MGAAARIIEPTLAEIVALNGRRPSGGRSRGRAGGVETLNLIGPPSFVSTVSARAWWRSDQRVVLSSGGVASWTDLLNNYVLSQGTAAAQPTYSASDAALNNRPSITGDGIQQWLEYNGVFASQFAGSDVPWSAYVIVRPASVATDGVFYGLSSSTVAGSRFHLTHVSSAAAWRSVRTDDAAASASQAAGTVVANTNYLVRVHFTGAAVTIVANGTTVINALALDVGALTCDRFTVFAQRQAGGAPLSLLSGKIAEVAVFAGKPSAAEETAMVGSYFTPRYGAPVA